MTWRAHWHNPGEWWPSWRRRKAEAWREGWIVGNRWAFTEADSDGIDSNPFEVAKTGGKR